MTQLGLDTDSQEQLTPPLVLRDYQAEAFDALVAYRSTPTDEHPYGGRRALVAWPTGAGKTVLFALFARCQKRMLVLAHREELLEQAAAQIRRALPGIFVGIEQADRHAPPNCKVVVASVQTFAMSPARLEALDPSEFSVVVVDEAHHMLATTYLKVLEHFHLAPGCSDLRDSDLRRRTANASLEERFENFEPPFEAPFLIGVTATPSRTDGKGLEWVLDDIVHSRTIRDGVEAGWLCRIKGEEVATGTDISDIQIRGGDFAEGALSQIVNSKKRNALVVGAYVDHCMDVEGGRQAIVYAVDVQHAKDLLECFLEHSIEAGIVLGESHTEDRRYTMRQFRQGKLRVLCNVGVATEGFDIPNTSAIILARPTKSSLLLCLDSETEVLTPEGWRRGCTVGNGDTIAAFDPLTEGVNWEQIQGKVTRSLYPDERMLALKSPTIDLRLTDTHRMLWSKRKGRAHAWQPWEVNSAGEVVACRDGWRLPVAGCQDAPGVPLSDDEIRFIGWVQTDGCVRKDGIIQISQSSGAPERLSEIEAVLRGCGFKWGVGQGKEPTNYGPRRYPQQVYRVGRREWECLRTWMPKADPEAWKRLEEMDACQWEILLGAWHLGDGSKQEGQSWTRRSYHLAISDKKVADWVQGMCVRRGWRANVAKAETVWFVHCRKGTARYVGGSCSKDRPTFRETPSLLDESVWCLAVPSGAFICRRNGKAAVVGNTQMIGRGTRPVEGKDHLLVIDVVDTCRKAGVQTLHTLFGLPPKLAIRDIGVIEAQRAMEALAEEFQISIPPELLGTAVTIEDVRRIAQEFDPLLAAQPDEEILSYTRLAWVRSPSGYVLSVPGEKGGYGNYSWEQVPGQLGIVTDLLGRSEVRFRGRGRRGERIGGVFPKLVGAFEAADDWLMQKRPDVGSMMDRKAGWRKQAPSEAQLRMLRRLRVEVPSGISRGDASMMIERAKVKPQPKRERR